MAEEATNVRDDMVDGAQFECAYLDDLTTAGRYYQIEGGTHLDSLYDQYPGELRPLLPCYRASFEALVRWVEEEDYKPPPSQLVRKPDTGDVVNSCPRLEGKQSA